MKEIKGNKKKNISGPVGYSKDILSENMILWLLLKEQEQAKREVCTFEVKKYSDENVKALKWGVGRRESAGLKQVQYGQSSMNKVRELLLLPVSPKRQKYQKAKGQGNGQSYCLARESSVLNFAKYMSPSWTVLQILKVHQRRMKAGGRL